MAAVRYRIPPLAFSFGASTAICCAWSGSINPDVVWFEKPIHFTPATIQAIKQTGAQTVCYNQDNPFGSLKENIWYQFYSAFRLFDLHCLFREADVDVHTVGSALDQNDPEL